MTSIDPDLETILKENGFFFFRQMPTGHIAGLHQFMFTVGICNRLDLHGYGERWCYEELGDAILALALWDGEGDPPGPWVKRKGRQEACNPKLFDFIGTNLDGSEHWERKKVVDRASTWEGHL